MKNQIRIILLLTILFSQCQLQEIHFISDPDYRLLIEKQFLGTKDLAKNRSAELFDVFDQNLTLEEKEALQFLYASMPLSDLADYNGKYFLKVVRTSLEARLSFSWGKDLPEEVFRHFVLPYRVNNENLDSARWVLNHEIGDRVQGMSLHDAALEVNHWCHEHVNYRGTDIRTSAPLSTIRTGYGRCGEESTLLVAALRSVCIPARQVYVPRWAHCDDNHAWVEVWVDGDWHFLGGCEPSPQFDQGWFKEPARRAMLVHTKAFGPYSGPEELLVKKNRYSELNVLSRYAKVKEVHVRVVDRNKQAIEGASVEFGLYNYAEFFPLFSTRTNGSGWASFTTAYGDLVISASNNDSFGFRKLNAGTSDSLVVILDRMYGDEFEESLQLLPPAKSAPAPVDTTGQYLCSAKLDQEDSLRTATIQKQFKREKAIALFQRNGWEEGDNRWRFLKKARGNFDAIYQLLLHPDQRKVLNLLEQIAEKDLRDAAYETLLDHLDNTTVLADDLSHPELHAPYVLSPRIKNEILSPYRSFLLSSFDDQFVSEFLNNPEVLVEWIIQNITINNDDQYYDLPITPIGVFKLKMSNEESRNVFFVAACRSFGMPARLSPGTLLPQIHSNDMWVDVHFDRKPGRKSLTYEIISNQALAFEPEYYIHFAIARPEQGKFQTLEFEYGQKLSRLNETLELRPAYYRLLTSKRLKDESILVDMKFFNIKPGSNHQLELFLPVQQEIYKAVGTLHSSIELLELNSGQKHGLENLHTKNGSVLVLFKPGEPVQHLLAELPSMTKEIEEWDGSFAMITTANQMTEADPSDIYPKNLNFYQTQEEDFASFLEKYKNSTEINNYPHIIIVNNRGQILFNSSGYQIGLPEQIVKVLHQMKKGQE
jgi:transglutaminase-like putative cysteine protease